ncbi:hypothetical protein J2Y54_001098 [Sphingomonas sp. BE123]|uniref:hypothetical protein n=1 Tax=Sphingomonas sp. BE123 TaxID=2817842 RepID=UPI00285A6AEA|nr:hypothetical protein [Sphingomonas sp. BE123]MDR6851605.1 hypothetical protein [Sphingomonas sp. BE123]
MPIADAAVLRWTNQSDPNAAAPGDADRLHSLNLDQRVVSVVSFEGEWSRIRFGAEEFRVRKDCLMPIGSVAFEVGDSVNAAGRSCTIRDAIWHFKDAEPNFYLEAGGKRLSKRFKVDDLDPV